MALWLDKYRPRTLDKTDYHPDISLRLKQIAATNNLPHLLFHGPPGAGKKTRVTAFLRQVFGPGAEKIKQDRRTFKTPTNRVVEINTLSSNYHIEINPSDAGSADTFVVQEIIKEIAQSSPLHLGGNDHDDHPNAMETDGKPAAKGIFGVSTKPKENKEPAAKVVKGGGFKVVLISDADTLSKTAQQALRRTMEKYISGCRLILISENLNRIIPPLRSRCLGVRIPAPIDEEMVSVMTKVLQAEEKTKIMRNEHTEKLLWRIAKASNRNMRRAMLMLQTCRVEFGQLSTIDTAEMELPMPDWQTFINTLAKKICQQQSPTALLDARKDLYELLANCIPPETIMIELCKALLKKVDLELRPDIIAAASFYQKRLQMGSKDIFHIEAFVAKFMFLYKRHLITMFG